MPTGDGARLRRRALDEAGATALRPRGNFESAVRVLGEPKLAPEKARAGRSSNVMPIRGLANPACSGQPCRQIVAAHRRAAFHVDPKNARRAHWPEVQGQKMINFDTHFPNRFAKLNAIRALVETTFSNLKELYGDRIRCRSVMGRRSEIWAKISVLNVRTITFRQILSGEFELTAARAAA